jgi:hypothetical protein
LSIKVHVDDSLWGSQKLCCNCLSTLAARTWPADVGLSLEDASTPEAGFEYLHCIVRFGNHEGEAPITTDTRTRNRDFALGTPTEGQRSAPICAGIQPAKTPCPVGRRTPAADCRLLPEQKVHTACGQGGCFGVRSCFAAVASAQNCFVVVQLQAQRTPGNQGVVLRSSDMAAQA